MQVEVDQSVRIKDSQDTVMAFSNDERRAIILPAKVKRSVELYLRNRYRKPRNVELRIFTAGLFLLLKQHLTTQLEITIDKEFPGAENEASIKGMLLNYIRKTFPNFHGDQIGFASIGKKSPAHKLAYAVHRGKEQANYTATDEDLLAML